MCVLLARSISIEFSSGESKTKDIEDEDMYEVEKTREDKNEGTHKSFTLLNIHYIICDFYNNHNNIYFCV